MHARACICMCMYVYIYVCMYVCMYLCMYVRMYLYIYIYIYIYILYKSGSTIYCLYQCVVVVIIGSVAVVDCLFARLRIIKIIIIHFF